MNHVKRIKPKQRNIIAGVCQDLAGVFNVHIWVLRALFLLLLLKFTVPAIIFYLLIGFVMKNTSGFSDKLSDCSGNIISRDMAPKILLISFVVISLQFSFIAWMS